MTDDTFKKLGDTAVVQRFAYTAGDNRKGGDPMNLEASACTGKERFDSPQLARKAATRAQARGHYRCHFCGYFHVGSDKWRPPSKTKLRSMNQRNAVKLNARRSGK